MLLVFDKEQIQNKVHSRFREYVRVYRKIEMTHTETQTQFYFAISHSPSMLYLWTRVNFSPTRIVLDER